MDKKITDFIVKEYKIFKWRLAPIDLLLLVFAAVFATMLRTCVVSYVSMEAPAYLEIVTGMKIATAVFDFSLSVICGVCVYHLTGHKRKAFLAYAIVLLLPVLAAGSAMWGLGDSIYVFFAILSIVFALDGKGNRAVVCYGISLFFGRYALFLLPVYVVLYLQKKANLLSFVAPLLGAWFRNGMMTGNGNISIPLFEAEKMMQKSREGLLSYHLPNFFQMIGPDKFVQEYTLVFGAITVAVFCVGIVLMWKKGDELVGEELISAALLFSLLIPYLMPGMDERAWLLADVLSVIFVMKHMDMYYVAVIQIIVSYIAYSVYFRGESVIPLCYVSFVALFLLVVVARFVMEREKPVFGFVKKEKEV